MKMNCDEILLVGWLWPTDNLFDLGGEVDLYTVYLGFS